MTRVNLKRRSDLPEDYQYLLDEDAMGEINLLSAMANNIDVMQSYMRYGSTLWADSGIDGADVERCILAVSRALNAEYEWNQHVPLAKKQGVSLEEITAIGTDKLSKLSDRAEILTAYAQAVATDSADDRTFGLAASMLDDDAIVGVTLLATHYVATQRFLSALNVPLDEEFVGWEPAN